MGVVAGFISARLYRLFNGSEWWMQATSTAIILPLFVIVCLCFIDIVDWFERSQAYLPISSVTSLCVFWTAINMPLVFVGSYWGYTIQKISVPVKTSRIERPLPNLPCGLNFYICTLVLARVSATCLTPELYFVAKSVWRAS